MRRRAASTIIDGKPAGVPVISYGCLKSSSTSDLMLAGTTRHAQARATRHSMRYSRVAFGGMRWDRCRRSLFSTMVCYLLTSP